MRIVLLGFASMLAFTTAASAAQAPAAAPQAASPAARAPPSAHSDCGLIVGGVSDAQ